MAFTEQNKADAYLFFVLAFNAAPGTVYGGQIVEAYESGMTTADIVAQYVEKPAFTSLYPTTQTANEFATALVNNVSSLSTKAAVKAAAVADIETALAAGWTKAQVVTQILGNLANKTVADAEWGTTVAQLNNKIAVAKALTEGDLALTSEDAAVLQGPLANVTEDLDTVATAINGAGSAATKIEALIAAQKAHADFLKAGDFADASAVVTALNDAADEVETVLGNADFSTIAGDKETVSAAMQAAIVSDAKKAFADDVTTKTTALDEAKTTWLNANAANKTLKVQLESYLKAVATAAAADDASSDADDEQSDAVIALNATTTTASAIANTAVDADTGVTTADLGADTGVEIINVQSGKLALTKAFTDVADAEQLAAATKLLDSIVAAQTAKANAEAADAAEADALDVITSKSVVVDATTVTATPPTAVATAAGNLQDAKDKTPALDKALKAYNDAMADLSKEAELQKAIDDAEKAFTDAGQDVPVTIAAGISTAGSNLFVLDGKVGAQTLTSFAADDKIYAGKGYTVSTDITKGDDAKLEVFFKANGASTDVYIEQKAFGSSTVGAADGNANFVKITLTGVAADKLELKDGFVQIAA